MKYLKLYENYVDDDWVEPTGTEWYTSSKEDIDEAMNEILQMGTKNVFLNNTVHIGDVNVEVKNFDGQLWIDLWVGKSERNQGKATQVLQKVLQIVDKHGIFAAVDPTPHTNTLGEAPSKQELVSFFKKMGFTNIVYGAMERTPLVSDEKFNELLDKISDKKELTIGEREIMRRYSGDETVVNNIQNSTSVETPREEPRVYSDEERKNWTVDPTYTHFALRKSDNKIVTGWEYNDLDAESIKEYTKMDIKDMFPDNKYSEFKINGLNSLKRQGINPFDTNNWAKS